MRLDVKSRNDSLEDALKSAETFLDTKLRLIKIRFSVFEQYEIRPLERRHIPKIWQYRIVCDKGQYIFAVNLEP